MSAGALRNREEAQRIRGNAIASASDQAPGGLTDHPQKGNDMTSPRRITLALAVGALPLLPTCIAAAQESGTFSIIRVSVAQYSSIDHGEGSAFAGPLEGTSTIIRSSAAPFVEAAHSVMRCVAYGKRSRAGMDLEVPCAATDADGDRVDTLAKRTAGDVEAGGGGRGAMVLTGATGKYAGISGTCEYDVAYLEDKWLVLMADCAWHRP